MAQIIKIADINAEELKPYASLTEAELRRSEGIFIAESVKVIKVALSCGLEPVSFLMEERQIEGIGKELIELSPLTPVYTAPRDVLASLTGFELTRGLLAAMRRPEEKSLDEVLKGAKRIAVLERLSDSTNVGAIFRNAAALGIDAVLLFHNCAEPLNRRTVRVSMGSVFLVPWAFFDKEGFKEPQSTAEYLKQKGFTTAALALADDSINVTDTALKSADKLALFLGAEGDGLSAGTINACDYTVKIPMYHKVDSLNVAAAATIAFWELSEK